MRIIFAIFFFSFSFFLKAQNIYVSSGMYSSRISISQNWPLQGYGLDRFDRNWEFGLEDFNNSYPGIDFINILIEKEISNSLSIKSGIYFQFKIIYEFKQWWWGPVPAGQSQWQYNSQYEEFPKFEVPLLLAYNFIDREKKLKLHIGVGPYLGYGIFKEVAYQKRYDVYNFDFGGEILLGIGAKKWQFSCYLLNGFRNLAKPSWGILKNAKEKVLGFNLTRVFNLRRISTNEKNIPDSN
jgi:hypothetical protein